MNTVTVLVDMSEPHRLAFAEPAQQTSDRLDPESQILDVAIPGSGVTTRSEVPDDSDESNTDENPAAPEEVSKLNVTMKATETVEPALDTLSYKELQKLAVEYDVKGNLPRDEMEAAIREAQRA
jgi:hypothetical protein